MSKQKPANERVLCLLLNPENGLIEILVCLVLGYKLRRFSNDSQLYSNNVITIAYVLA